LMRSDEIRLRSGLTPVGTPSGIIDAIEILLEHDTAGDPIRGLKWTRKTTGKIAAVTLVSISSAANDGRRGKIEGNLHGAVSRVADGCAAITILSAVRVLKNSLIVVHPTMETARSVVRP
jgi:hypothetical protein